MGSLFDRWLLRDHPFLPYMKGVVVEYRSGQVRLAYFRLVPDDVHKYDDEAAIVAKKSVLRSQPLTAPFLEVSQEPLI